MVRSNRDASGASSLRARLLDWLSPLSIESEAHGFQLEECETEQGITLLLGSRSGRLVIELERADRARPCFATTERFNVYYEALGRERRDLEESERAVLERVVGLIRSRERELDVPPPTHAARRVEVREITADR